MGLTELSVKRPAAICMVVALLIGLGIMGYSRMGSDLLPSMNIPVITISTSYNGASADDIKQDIVKPIEDAVSGISGIDTIDSTSTEGVGRVIITFNLGVDMNSALIDVQKAIDNVSGKLPTDADKPVIYKVDTDNQPIIMLTVSGTAPFDELYDEASKVQNYIEETPGVGNVSLRGADQKQLLIKLDKTAMDYYGVNTNALISKLEAENISVPAGQIEQQKMNENVRVVGEFQSVDEVRNLLIPTTSGSTVRLDDIATVTLDYPEATSMVTLNGKKTISMEIQKQSDSNVVETVDNLKSEVAKLQKTMPAGVNLSLTNDTTTFIRSSLSEVKVNLIEGIITTAIVLLFFLRSWKSSLAVLIAIPTSLVATFFMMYEFNFTLNMLSLMGLSLCIGILVDDSIVVLENIQRHLKMGKTPFKAAIEGRSEIGLAAIAITLCDVVVFLPVAFMSGITGQLFKEFGLTIVFATLFSLFVSFTVTPMLASRLFKQKTEDKKNDVPEEHKKGIFGKAFYGSSDWIDKAAEVYERILIWSLDNRKKVLLTVSVLVILSIALVPLKFISTEYLPTTDQGSFTISLNLSPGSTLAETDAKVVQVEKYLKTLPGVQMYYSSVGSSTDETSASIYVTLVPENERKESQTQLANQVRSWGRRMAGVRFNVSEPQMGMGGGGRGSAPVSISIVGDNDDTLKNIANKIQNLISTVPGVVDVNNSSTAGSSELKVSIDRLAASQYGVSVSDISSVLRTAIAGTTAGTYYIDNNEYDITVKYADDEVKNAEDIAAINIINSSGQKIPLSQVASIQMVEGPKTITREDREDRVTVTANIQGRALGSINQDVNAKLKSISVPAGYYIAFGGTQKQMTDTFSALMAALSASIVLVYMILVVLYESFLTPFIRMISLPCAIIGAFGMLALTGKTLNMMSMIGLIMLDGLSSKNGTLLIDYTNTLMKRGMDLREALITAGKTRLRPIMMTSLTMVVGMLPVALSIGEGSELKSSMAVVIIGGMIASTLLSPIVLPVVYTLMDDLNKSIFKKRTKISYSPEVK